MLKFSIRKHFLAFLLKTKQTLDVPSNDCGRALSFWGDGFNTVIDGNTLRNNAGIAYDDLSKYHTIKRWWMQFAGAYYNQILYNKVSDGRGYGGNIATVGGYTGGIESGMVSLIVRGNKLSNDVSLCAWPRIAADKGLNYLGIVFEDNTVENTHVGCYIGEGVEAILNSLTNSMMRILYALLQPSYYHQAVIRRYLL